LVPLAPGFDPPHPDPSVLTHPHQPSCRFAEAQRAGRTTTRAERTLRTGKFLNSEAATAAAAPVVLLTEASADFVNPDASFFNDFTDSDSARPATIRTPPPSWSSTPSTTLNASKGYTNEPKPNSKPTFPPKAREADLCDSPWMDDRAQGTARARTASGSPKAWDPAHWDSSDFQKGPYFAS